MQAHKAFNSPRRRKERRPLFAQAQACILTGYQAYKTETLVRLTHGISWATSVQQLDAPTLCSCSARSKLCRHPHDALHGSSCFGIGFSNPSRPANRSGRKSTLTAHCHLGGFPLLHLSDMHLDMQSYQQMAHETAV